MCEHFKRNFSINFFNNTREYSKMLKHSNCHAMVFRVTCGRDETSESKKKERKKVNIKITVQHFQKAFTWNIWFWWCISLWVFLSTNWSHYLSMKSVKAVYFYQIAFMVANFTPCHTRKVTLCKAWEKKSANSLCVSIITSRFGTYDFPLTISHPFCPACRSTRGQLLCVTACFIHLSVCSQLLLVTVIYFLSITSRYCLH